MESRDSGREILIHRKADLKEFEKRKILKAIAKSLEENKSIDLIDLSEEISFKNIPNNSKEDKKDEESETFLIKKDNILLKGKNASIEIKDGNIVLRTLGNVKIFGEHVDLGTF